MTNKYKYIEINLISVAESKCQLLKTRYLKSKTKSKKPVVKVVIKQMLK